MFSNETPSYTSYFVKRCFTCSRFTRAWNNEFLLHVYVRLASHGWFI